MSHVRNFPFYVLLGVGPCHSQVHNCLIGHSQYHNGLRSEDRVSGFKLCRDVLENHAKYGKPYGTEHVE